MIDSVREEVEQIVNHFLDNIEGNMPESQLKGFLDDAFNILAKQENQEDVEVVRNYALIGVYYTPLDEKKGLECLKRTFDLCGKMGLVEVPAPFVDDKGKEYNTVVYSTMASYLSSAGEKEEATKYFSMAYSKYDKECDKMSIAVYALDYASCLFHIGKQEESEQLLHRGIQASYEAFGEYNPFALSLIKALEMLNEKIGKKEEAKKYKDMWENMAKEIEKYEEEEDECGCGHDHHHHHDDECGCGCGHDHHHHDDECGCGHDHHHHHDGDCDCGCHH